MANIIRIKRKLGTQGGATGAPAVSAMKNAELAYNENDRTLYYGLGVKPGTTDGANEVIPIGGQGFVDAGGAVDVLQQPLTVYLGSGQSQGSYDDGETIPTGTSLLDVVKNMLQKEIAATYSQPSLSLSNATGSYEIGTTISPNILGNFTKNDAGNATSYTLRYNGSDIYTDNSSPIDFSYTMSNLQLTGTHTFKGIVAYGDGAIKNNNQGNPSPTGRILTGTKQTTDNDITVYRKYFYGVDTQTAAATTSAQIRSLSNSSSNAAGNNTTFTIIVPVGSRRVTIAYPDTVPDIDQILYVQGSNNNVIDTFDKTFVSVEGADGYNPITYKVYTYILKEANGLAMTYNVTI